MDHRILVPIDFTEITENALKYAIGAAKSLETGINLLHIAENETKKITSMEALEALIYKHEGHGVSLKAHTRVGNIYDDIAAAAEDLGAGIIFMGTHGMKGLQRIFGSHALKVITSSKVPFVITQDKIPADNEINDIVVPIDMASEDKQILTSVIRSSHAFNAKVHLFVNKRKDEFHENAVARNLAFSKKYLSDHEVNYTVSHTNEMDTFDRELIRFSQNIGADMVAIVNHHEGGLTNLLGSSFDQHVITNDARIPVLITNAVDNTKVDDIFGVFK
jgi:nucleotide-binding universal stress UspA family protein